MTELLQYLLLSTAAVLVRHLLPTCTYSDPTVVLVI